ILDSLCSWPTPAAFAPLRQVAQERWAQDRAMLALMLRFGQPDLKTWEQWMAWQAEQERLWQSEQEVLQALLGHHTSGLLLILYSQTADLDSSTLDALVKATAESMGPMDLPEFIRSWSSWISSEERLALGVVPEPAPALAVPPILPGVEQAGRRRRPSPPP